MRRKKRRGKRNVVESPDEDKTVYTVKLMQCCSRDMIGCVEENQLEGLTSLTRWWWLGWSAGRSSLSPSHHEARRKHVHPGKRKSEPRHCRGYADVIDRRGVTTLMRARATRTHSSRLHVTLWATESVLLRAGRHRSAFPSRVCGNPSTNGYRADN
jgi:hypothetical protein